MRGTVLCMQRLCRRHLHDIPQCSVLRLTFLSADFVAVRSVKALKCHNLIFFISKYIKSGQKVQCTFDFGTTFILNKSFRLQLHFGFNFRWIFTVGTLKSEANWCVFSNNSWKTSKHGHVGIAGVCKRLLSCCHRCDGLDHRLKLIVLISAWADNLMWNAHRVFLQTLKVLLHLETFTLRDCF